MPAIGRYEHPYSVVEFDTELAAAHDRHGLFEIPDLAAMKIRCGARDVA